MYNVAVPVMNSDWCVFELDEDGEVRASPVEAERVS